MNVKQMDRFTNHCNHHFGQKDPLVLHQDGQRPHVDTLVYRPDGKYPYWKLVTMGASDYPMPKSPGSLGRRNEYVMFVNPEEELDDKEQLLWYANKLYMIACYTIMEKVALSYGHSMEWEPEEGSDMVGVFLEMPQLMESVDFLRCKLGFLKEAVILQVIPLTRPELDQLLKIGPEAFSNWLYPEDEGNAHVLAQRSRTDKF